MLNNVTLDVAIGFCFIFLIYSLLSTTVKECFATIFDYRGRMLERGIEQMLDGKNYRYFWWEKWINSLIFVSKRPTVTRSQKITYADFVSSSRSNTNKHRHSVKRLKLNRKAQLFASKIITHPLYLRSGENSRLFKKPNYLKSEVFSDILLDVLNPNPGTLPSMQAITAYVQGRPEPMNIDLQQILLIYIRQANGDCQRFQLIIENWFDTSMGRVSGWYRRQTQIILLSIGFFLALAFNIDSIAIYKILAKDKTALEGLVQMASRSRPQLQTVVLNQGTGLDKQPSIDLSNDKVYQKLLAQDSNSRNVFGLSKDSAQDGAYWPWHKHWLKFNPQQAGGFTTLLGFLITAIAVSLGAPFWFDLLNKLANIRVAGTKPEPAKSATSKTADINKKPDPKAKG